MDGYFNYLSSLIEGDEYSILLSILDDTEFIVKVRGDENRLYDVLNLRNLYGGKIERIEPTVLELLISLAVTCENKIMRGDEDNRTPEWFWMICTNLGLDKYNDIYCENNLNSSYEIRRIVEVFNERTYKRNGVGSAFPLPNTKKDMRRVELWYQLNWYMAENFKYEL